MRKIIAVAIWAWIPFCGQPLWGQTQGIGVEHGSHKKQQSSLTTAQTKDDQRGTQNAPIFVDVLSHPKSKDEAAEAQTENHRKALVDGWTLGTAVAVAIFTGLLVYVGWCGVRAAVRTLQAIKAQTDHMVNSERAWVIIRPHHDRLHPVVPGTIMPYNRFMFDIINKGKTAAKLFEVNGNYRIVCHGGEPLSATPAYDVPLDSQNIEFIHGAVMVPDEPLNGVSVNVNEIAHIGEVLQGIAVLYVYGYLGYFDFSKERRVNQFCFRYVHNGFPGENGTQCFWAADGPPAYNTHS